MLCIFIKDEIGKFIGDIFFSLSFSERKGKKMKKKQYSVQFLFVCTALLSWLLFLLVAVLQRSGICLIQSCLILCMQIEQREKKKINHYNRQAHVGIRSEYIEIFGCLVHSVWIWVWGSKPRSWNVEYRKRDFKQKQNQSNDLF